VMLCFVVDNFIHPDVSEESSAFIFKVWLALEFYQPVKTKALTLSETSKYIKLYIYYMNIYGPLLPFEDFTISVCCPLDGLPARRIYAETFWKSNEQRNKIKNSQHYS